MLSNPQSLNLLNEGEISTLNSLFAIVRNVFFLSINVSLDRQVPARHTKNIVSARALLNLYFTISVWESHSVMLTVQQLPQSQ